MKKIILQFLTVIVALISAGTSLFTLSRTTTTSIFPSAYEQAIGSDWTFSSSDAYNYRVYDVKPGKGNLEIALKQTTGNSNIHYSVYYKKNTTSSYSYFGMIRFVNNNAWNKAILIKSCNGLTTYNMKFVKTDSLSTTSKGQFTWAVTGN